MSKGGQRDPPRAQVAVAAPSAELNGSLRSANLDVMDGGRAGLAATILIGVALPGCSLEAGGGCPTDLEPDPNGREDTLFFVGGGYTQNGLWRQVTIPGVIQPDAFYVTTGTITFNEPVCVTGASGFPLFDDDGHLRCEWDVDSSTTSDTCSLPLVRQQLDGVAIETTGKGTNVVLGVQTTEAGIAIQVACDLARGEGLLPRDHGVHLVLREPDGDVRYEDTVYITCREADHFGLRYTGRVGDPPTNEADGTVYVGDEFYVHYNLTVPQGSPAYPQALGGYGMAPADSPPAFEILEYEHKVGSPPQLLLRALAPADHPRLVAGAIDAPLPVSILPAP